MTCARLGRRFTRSAMSAPTFSAVNSLYVTRAAVTRVPLRCEHPDEATSYGVVDLSHLLDQDSGLGEILDLDIGEENERSHATAKWHRSRIAPNGGLRPPLSKSKFVSGRYRTAATARELIRTVTQSPPDAAVRTLWITRTTGVLGRFGSRSKPPIGAHKSADGVREPDCAANTLAIVTLGASRHSGSVRQEREFGFRVCCALAASLWCSQARLCSSARC